MNYYKDDDKQFILELTNKFLRDEVLRNKFQTPDMYILHILDELVESKEMLNETARRIFSKTLSTVNEILVLSGV